MPPASQKRSAPQTQLGLRRGCIASDVLQRLHSPRAPARLLARYRTSFHSGPVQSLRLDHGSLDTLGWRLDQTSPPGQERTLLHVAAVCLNDPWRTWPSEPHGAASCSMLQLISHPSSAGADWALRRLQGAKRKVLALSGISGVAVHPSCKARFTVGFREATRSHQGLCLFLAAPVAMRFTVTQTVHMVDAPADGKHFFGQRATLGHSCSPRDRNPDVVYAPLLPWLHIPVRPPLSKVSGSVHPPASSNSCRASPASRCSSASQQPAEIDTMLLHQQHGSHAILLER